MTATQQPVETRNGITFYDDGLGGLTAYRGVEGPIGMLFPRVLDEPGGKWFARRRGEDAKLCGSRRSAVAWLVKTP